MKKVNFYKITGPLPTFDSKYEGLFVTGMNGNPSGSPDGDPPPLAQGRHGERGS